MASIFHTIIHLRKTVVERGKMVSCFRICASVGERRVGIHRCQHFKCSERILWSNTARWFCDQRPRWDTWFGNEFAQYWNIAWDWWGRDNLKPFVESRPFEVLVFERWRIMHERASAPTVDHFQYLYRRFSALIIVRFYDTGHCSASKAEAAFWRNRNTI